MDSLTEETIDQPTPEDHGEVLARVCSAAGRRASRNHHIVMRLDDARAFVREYAANLSAGSLFVPSDPGGVQRLDTVTVHLQVAHLGGFRLGARVELVVDEEQAARTGGCAGLGLSITCAPVGFHERLRDHLRVLGRRRDAVVLVGDVAIGRRLAAAGFCVQQAPDPDDLLSGLVLCDAPVLALVVPFWAMREYAKSSACIGASDLLVGVAPNDGMHNLVRCLDERMGVPRASGEWVEAGGKNARASARPSVTGERSVLWG